MGIFDIFRKKPGNHPIYLYTEEELDEYESYVSTCLGSYDQVFHELVSSDVHLDVIPIPPDEETPFYKFVTMGAGAYRMNIPDALKEYELECAEYIIYLPADWNIQSPEEKDYWPIHLLKSIARLPIYANTWLAYGHTIAADEKGIPYAENTQLCAAMLVNGVDRYYRTMELKLSSGRMIRFYQIIPLYKNELAYKMEHDADAMLDLLEKIDDFDIIYPDRKNAIDNSNSTEEKQNENS